MGEHFLGNISPMEVVVAVRSPLFVARGVSHPSLFAVCAPLALPASDSAAPFLNRRHRHADSTSMREKTTGKDLILGFTTIVDRGEPGIVGGYLLLDGRARPLEFHCTAPIIPNRAQQILYGPTLKEFFYGDQLALTLWRHCKLPVSLQLTDQVDIAAFRDGSTVPVVLVSAPADAPPETRWHRLDLGACGTVASMAVDENIEAAQIQGQLKSRGDWDLLEPFQRIREALEEALGRQAA